MCVFTHTLILMYSTSGGRSMHIMAYACMYIVSMCMYIHTCSCMYMYMYMCRIHGRVSVSTGVHVCVVCIVYVYMYMYVHNILCIMSNDGFHV